MSDFSNLHYNPTSYFIMTNPRAVFSLPKYINVSFFARFQALKALLDFNCNP